MRCESVLTEDPHTDVGEIASLISRFVCLRTCFPFTSYTFRKDDFASVRADIAPLS
jgi:hypothetical protein